MNIDPGFGVPSPNQGFKGRDPEPSVSIVAMALRDYFAGQAMVGMLMRGTITDMPLLAEKCWHAADWMLSEREKTK